MKCEQLKDVKKVYILLTRTTTVFSRIIHMATRGDYTHASISLEPGCYRLYSFARRYQRLPLPAGFVSESIYKGLLAKCCQSPCALYELEVTSDTYQKLSEELAYMKHNAGSYHYSCVGTIFCFFQFAYERKSHFFCSQFVADILERTGALELDKSPSLYKPIDFMSISQLKLCYKGTLVGLCRKGL